jgi:hypothetical protein
LPYGNRKKGKPQDWCEKGKKGGITQPCRFPKFPPLLPSPFFSLSFPPPLLGRAIHKRKEKGKMISPPQKNCQREKIKTRKRGREGKGKGKKKVQSLSIPPILVSIPHSQLPKKLNNLL